eukprot:2092352-Karenia_brevis.AAC.1
MGISWAPGIYWKCYNYGGQSSRRTCIEILRRISLNTHEHREQTLKEFRVKVKTYARSST